MERRGQKITFLLGSVTALFGAVAACSTYGTDEVTPPTALGSNDAGPEAAVPIVEPEAGTPPPACPPTTDLLTSAQHCGACGHDCLGGLCVAGKCQPVVVTKGVTKPGYLRAAGADLFVSTTDGMTRVPKAGGLLAAIYGGASCLGLAVDETHAFCATSFGVQKVPFGGGTAKLIPTSTVDEVAVGGGGIYVCSVKGYDVRRFDLAGSNESTVMKSVKLCESLVVTASEVFAGGDRILRAAPESAKGGELVGTVPARRLAVDDTWVYSIQSSSPSVHRSARVVGSISAELAKGGEPIEDGDLTLDDAHVYWTTGRPAGGVYRVAKAGGPVEAIATGLALPKGIAVDDVAVYWSEGESGKIMKRAK